MGVLSPDASPWTAALTQSAIQVGAGFVAFLPSLVVGLFLLVVGWLVGRGTARVVTQLLRALRVEDALQTGAAKRFVQAFGWEASPALLVGRLLQWFVFAVFLMAALEVFGLQQANAFLREVVLSYLPKVLVAVLILLMGLVVGDVVGRVAEGAARSAELPSPSAGAAGLFARWAIWITAALAALYQLGIAAVFVQTLFTGMVMALSLGVGLAFGLGGQGVARRTLERLEQRLVGMPPPAAHKHHSGKISPQPERRDSEAQVS